MRRKPSFEPDSYEAQHPKEESPSCFLMLLITVIGYFIFSALSRTTLSGFANKSDQFICYGTLIGIAVLFVLASRQEKQDKQKLKEARQEWKRTCKSAEVAILNHRYYAGGTTEDEYGIPHSSHASYHLDLELSADQKDIAPIPTMVSVDVRMPVYAQLQNRNTVRIYYKPEAPFTFLLEEELLA